MTTKIQASAKDQECCLNLVGICNYDTATTVLVHIGFGGGDATNKRNRPNERNGVFSCSACHDMIDGRTEYPELMDKDRWFYIARGLVRTAEIRDEMGI